MKTINFLTGVAIIALAFSVSSCTKDENTDSVVSSDEIVALQDDALVSDMLEDVDNETDDVVNGNKVKSALNDTTGLAGRNIMWAFNNDGTKTAVITYNNFQNSYANNERVKNGVIRVVVTGTRSENTYRRQLTFENFTINGHKIEGTKTIEKMSQYTYRITLNAGKVTFPDSSFMTCECTRTRTMVEGENTPLYIWDDEYTIEGSATGQTRKGEQYTKQINNQIRVCLSYQFPVSGTVALTIGQNTYMLDYGNGTKDNKATVTNNGESKEITLNK